MKIRSLSIPFAIGVGLLLPALDGVEGRLAAQEAWWPSEWGAEDQRGAANRLTPAKVLEAAAGVGVRLMFSPLPLKGATGSPGNPVAIH